MKIQIKSPTVVSVLETSRQKLLTSPYLDSEWNLYRDGITQSMLCKFLECPEKFKNAYVKSLVPISSNTPSLALDFGSYVHDVLDYVYTGFKDSHNQESYYENLQSNVLGVIKEYYDSKREQAFAFGENIDSLELQTALAEVLIPIYFTLYRKDFLEMNWVALEEVFDVAYTKASLPIRRRGKFDGVVRIAGKLWLFETKTKGRIVEENIADKLSLDLQVFMYLSAIRDIYDEQPVGVIYNIIRRPQERQGKKETIQEFAARVALKVRQDPSHYFMRMQAAVLPFEIEQYEREIFDPIMAQLDSWYRGGFHYKNPTSCTGGFFPCPYLPLCGRDDKAHYRKKDALFSELTMIPLKNR